ncbi:RidA family protein [Cutibacterium sp. V947]|uniref:RidA family protein n=1 Tax=unclassified Cutibacterium TaxID=2649671 RepID=UPI003EE1C9F8
MSATTKCAELGITLPPVAAPVADYVPAIQTGSQILTSGQLPLVNGGLTAVGKVGDTVSAEQATEAARTAVLNAIAAASEVAGGLDAIKRVVRVVVFVNSAPDFTGQAGVANGASQVLGQIFGDQGRHARSAVGVATLPLGSPVEVELTVEA